MLLAEVFSETTLFRHSSDCVFGVRNLRNTKALRVIFFFQIIQNSMHILKIKHKILKKLFFSYIIASELVSLNVSIKNKILVIGSQCLNMQSQDLACQ